MLPDTICDGHQQLRDFIRLVVDHYEPVEVVLGCYGIICGISTTGAESIPVKFRPIDQLGVQQIGRDG